MGVPEVIKISSFMDAVKSPELAKHFSNKVPVTVNEMMERLDDFVRSEEAYASSELPKWEAKPPSERCKIKRKGLSWKICSSTGKDNQCDQCNLGKGQEAERTGGNRGMDEHPYNLPVNTLRRYLR
ncbi:hypothetical protein Tco_1578810 [Tanacetum coccineum]